MRRLASLNRSVDRRRAKVKFTIFTEGRNTEPEYFKALRKQYAGTILDIAILGAAGVPLTIAQKAKARLSEHAKMNKDRRNLARGDRSFANRDQVWAVFDRDEHPHVEEARAICRQSGVRVALSNPCFELWLILHIQEYDRAGDRRDVQRALTQTECGYDHNDGKSPDCDRLIASIEVAEDRASRQLDRRTVEGDPIRPPFTEVYELTREIRKASGKHRKG